MGDKKPYNEAYNEAVIPEERAVSPSPYLTHRVQAAGDLLPEGLVLRRNAHLPETHGGKKAGSGLSTPQNPILSAQLLPRTLDGPSGPPSLDFTSLGCSFYLICCPRSSSFGPNTASGQVAGPARGEGTA